MGKMGDKLRLDEGKELGSQDLCSETGSRRKRLHLSGVEKGCLPAGPLSPGL